jgi:hypothetical protein
VTVFEPFLCRLVATDIKFPCGKWNIIEILLLVYPNLTDGFFLICEFKYLSLAEDGEIIAQAKKAIEYLLRDDPKLNKTQHLQVRAKLVKLLRGSENYFEIA